MTVQELIGLLQEFNPDAEIRLAFQPDWPFEHTIGDVVGTGHYDDQVVYISECQQAGYLPNKAAVALGWAEESREENYDDFDED